MAGQIVRIRVFVNIVVYRIIHCTSLVSPVCQARNLKFINSKQVFISRQCILKQSFYALKFV